MSQEQPKASFITFYSFKGGVGRSMALINTAGILAGRGFRVLVIDLDLEAPGLSYLDPDAPTDSPRTRKGNTHPVQLGFVDLLSDAKQHGEDADLFKMSAANLAKRYTQPYHLPDELRDFKDGSLHIMPAGKIDASYAQRLDALNLHQLYEEGLGEPLIRAFKKKLAEADLYDYVLIDSRTGFSDEAGICTRDLADHLMILSGLNRQNVEGTCEFLKALRAATEGDAPKFQIILSPVPNGEDALLDEREAMAKAMFETAWGSEVDLSLQIPYHPQLALTEEPHIFRRRRGYLFDAYRDIERRMLSALGHEAWKLMRRVEETLQQKDYSAVLRDLRHIGRLDDGGSALSRVAGILATAPKATLKNGSRVVEFVVDHAAVDEWDWESRELVERLARSSFDLAERLFQRIIEAAPSDADILGRYALFLDRQIGDLDGAEDYYKRAIEADPKDANILANYGQFLVGLARLSEGEKALRSAFKQLDRSSNKLNIVEVCFSLWLVSLMQKHDTERWEREFKFLLQRGFRRNPWSFDRMLEQAEKSLPPDEFEYAKSLALAFLDEGKVADLEQYERWRNLEPKAPKDNTQPI